MNKKQEGKTVGRAADGGEKWNIPRGTAAKNTYRDNKYDRAELAVPKGFRARMKQIAQGQGYSSYNSYVVDAKSILGVYGLDLTRVLTVTCHGYSKEFDSYLRNFAIAC